MGDGALHPGRAVLRQRRCALRETPRGAAGGPADRGPDHHPRLWGLHVELFLGRVQRVSAAGCGGDLTTAMRRKLQKLPVRNFLKIPVRDRPKTCVSGRFGFYPKTRVSAASVAAMIWSISSFVAISAGE